MFDDCDYDRLEDNLINLEEKYIALGEQEGTEKGRILGYYQGFEVGLQRGEQLGSELGTYYGSIIAWNLAIKKSPNEFPSRTLKLTPKLKKLLESFPNDPTNPELDSILTKIRSSFKVLNSLMKGQHQLIYEEEKDPMNY